MTGDETRLCPTSDHSNGRSIISKLDDTSVFLGGHTDVFEEGVQQGTQYRALEPYAYERWHRRYSAHLQVWVGRL